MAWATEYTYRRIFPMSHADYLDEPREAVRWLTRIHKLYVAEGVDPVTGNRRATGTRAR